MNNLYESIGITKQAFHNMLDRKLRKRSEEMQILKLVYEIRNDHPTMGLRDMYYKLSPPSIGRDVFEAMCKSDGLSVKKYKNWRRTTDSSGVIRFDNLLIDIIINRINQVYQSDITYFDICGKFHYITFVEDCFSRRILGYSVSSGLTTEETTLPALRMAIKIRSQESMDFKGVIFHSDGGGQYYDKEFLKITSAQRIKNSMCEYPWENGKVERLNGVIKNNYLIHRGINSFDQLQKEVDRTVLLYNNEKPHIGLGRKTPIQYEIDYLRNEQQPDGEKSATELKSQFPEGRSALRAENNNPSGSNIALELKNSKIKRVEKTVNVI